MFSGWIVLLITQTTLIQTRHVKQHRALGLAAIGLGALLPIVGVWVAIAMARVRAAHGVPGAIPFMIIPFADMLPFTHSPSSPRPRSPPC